ncbi:hypothetical protein PT974_00007 [Cladobotryum mycophilum]|uniref:Subtilisin-like serine protease n=1 Tax=Cladobotryum mycophilum TaxID=491253 RepID=A0ABR0T0J6_9HYPO
MVKDNSVRVLEEFVAPFDPENEVFQEEPVLPGTYQNGKEILSLDKDDQNLVKQYMTKELDVTRLNEIHKHLWLAGLPQISRALHNQVRVGRQIRITEKADLHLVWRDNVLYLKPLPDYLLSHSCWANTLCTDRELFESARGFIFSYTWLIRHKSDLRVAHEQGLVSDAIKWEKWAPFSAAVVSNINSGRSDINPRYVYGELRLKRLNLIYRFCTNTFKFKTLIRGYEYDYHQYSTYFERNFKWVLTAIVYISVVLAAMQVGLATTELKDNARFSRASYGFTMFSILAPLITLVMGAIIMLMLAAFNVRFALRRRVESHDEFEDAFGNESVKKHRH